MHFFEACSTVYDEISSRAPLLIGKLAAEQMLEPFHSHPWPRQHALALHRRRSAYDDGYVNTLFGAGLEQERDLEHGHSRAVPSPLAQEIDLCLYHHGVNDVLEPSQSFGVAGHLLCQQLPVDPILARHARKRGLDLLNRLPLIEAMHASVGIKHWNAAAGGNTCSRPTPHRHPAGKTYHQHQAPPSVDATCALSSLVTSGRIPNQRSKPGTA